MCSVIIGALMCQIHYSVTKESIDSDGGDFNNLKNNLLFMSYVLISDSSTGGPTHLNSTIIGLPSSLPILLL